MKCAAAIRAMLANGLTIDQALVALEAIEGSRAPLSNAERQARYRARKKEADAIAGIERNENNESNVTPVMSVTNVTDEAGSRARVLYGEDIYNIPPTDPTGPTPTASEQSPTEKPKTARRKRNDSREAIRAELALVLDAPRADALAAYRIAKGAAQTVHAARLLVEELAKTGFPNEAADLMMLRDWRGFKLEWWRRERGEARAGPARPPPSAEAPLSPRMQILSEIYHESANLECNEDDPPTSRADDGGGGGRPFLRAVGA